MPDQEIVINLREEIEQYAAPVNHTHSNYAPDATVSTNGTKAVQSKGIVTYVTSKITQAINNFKTDTLPSLIEEHITEDMSEYVKTTDLEEDYLTQSAAEETYATKSEIPQDIDINIYAHPVTTTTKIDYLVNPGYYQYVGSDATFYCQPDNVHYTNGLIKVERESNHIIQHVYSTSYSPSTQKYKIDGREFTRTGYTSTTNDETIPYWEDQWRVVNIPWKKRNDLLKVRGENVSENGFSIYECTGGYVFQWQQEGSQQEYQLPMNQYLYGSVHTYKDLPIAGPFVFSNLIGHIDIKITEDDFRVRSVNKKNEKVVGVNASYFVPRTN